MGFEKTGEYFAGWSTTKDRSGTNRSPGATITPEADIPLYVFWATNGEHQKAVDFKYDAENAEVLAWLYTDLEYVDATQAGKVLKTIANYNALTSPVQALLYEEKAKLTSFSKKITSFLASPGALEAATGITMTEDTSSGTDLPNPLNMQVAYSWDSANDVIKFTLSSPEGSDVAGGYATSATFNTNFAASGLISSNGTDINPITSGSGTTLLEDGKFSFITLTGIIDNSMNYKVKIVQKNPSLNLYDTNRPYFFGWGTPGVYKERVYNPGTGAVDSYNNSNDTFTIIIANGAETKKATLIVTYDYGEVGAYTRTFEIDWSGVTIN